MSLLSTLLLTLAPLATSAPQDAIEQALARAGDNRPELEKALAAYEGERLEGMRFLIEHMPDSDLVSLNGDFLIENVRLAYEVREKTAWAKSIPKDIFLNDVLPYANVNETRDAWRRDFVEKFLPLVEDCKTAAEAAQRLNEKIFPMLGVRYSTQRKKADQSPLETLENGLASCTGLSIILADGCRAIGVPARLAGIPKWVNKNGNHTWVEVWDGEWHFTGAAEPDGRGLNHAWFQGDASLAKIDEPMHSIWASSFKATGHQFPLIWAPDIDWVHGVNVTHRYAKQAETPKKSGLELRLAEGFGADPEAQKTFTFDRSLEDELVQDEARVKALAWEAYKAAEHPEMKADFDANRVRSGAHESPYTVKTVGERPENGWALFIAMHGGGGVPKEVNDSQWEHMKIYYKDQPDVGGYLYLALRAPNDTWNGFYTDYVYPLIEQLCRQFLVFGDVDPDKVVLMGYSHGGYGAFSIGPKIPDHFAAVHASAAAPTDGQSSPRNLRNTVFTFMIGENDTAYGRAERCKKFDQAIRELRGDRTDIFPVKMEWKEGHGHGGLPDRDKIRDMAPNRRNTTPRELTWSITDSVVRDHFWLSVDTPKRGMEIDVTLVDNVARVRAENVDSFTLWLDSRLVDFGKPLTIEIDEKAAAIEIKPSLQALCESILRRGDPSLAGVVRVDCGR